MELFLPSIAALLIVGLIVFLILPRLGAPVLATLSILLLIYGIYNHIQLFSSEYRYSTWQDRLKFYGPFIMIGVMILLLLMYLGYLFGTKGVNALPANAVPINTAADVVNATNEAANTVLNATTEAVGNVVNTATEAVNTAINTVKNVFGMNNGNNNIKYNNGGRSNGNGLLANLGGILATPVNNRRPLNR
jgi:hypothetical protein